MDFSFLLPLFVTAFFLFITTSESEDKTLKLLVTRQEKGEEKNNLITALQIHKTDCTASKTHLLKVTNNLLKI